MGVHETLGDSSQERGWRSRPNGNAVRLVLFGVFVVDAVFSLFIGPALLTNFDRSHRTEIRCRVDGADGRAASPSNRGVGGSIPQVTIRTSDCGDLILREGVTRANSADLVKQLKRSSVFDIQVGEGSWKLRGVLDALHRDPTAFSFSPVD